MRADLETDLPLVFSTTISPFPDMASRFIGSSGHLRPNQCQNDVWVTQGGPNNPVDGDARLIFQAVNNPVGGIILRKLERSGWLDGLVHAQ
jgi:hypothetical protein